METPTLLFIIFISLVLLLAISYFLFRWIFSIKRQLWNQKVQISVLIKIATKLGVPHSEIDLIETFNNNPNDEFLK